MKTYTESRNETPFDWNEFLNRKERSDAEWELAHLLSGDWVSCACGNQCDVIPRNDVGKPDDELLSELGMQFHNRILFGCDIEEAKIILLKIEERSKYLIEQINLQSK
jgi:hypothetical protein